MDGTVAAAGVGSGLNQMRFQAAYQMRILQKQQEAIRGAGEAVIQLVRQAMVPTSASVGGNLNITA